MSSLPRSYDQWKRSPAEYNRKTVSTCPTCWMEFTYHPEYRNCASCGAVICEECEVQCECGQYFCEVCSEEVDGMKLCGECKVLHLQEREEAEMAAGAIPGYLRAFDWALGKIV